MDVYVEEEETGKERNRDTLGRRRKAEKSHGTVEVGMCGSRMRIP